jgi:hypothetical protein
MKLGMNLAIGATIASAGFVTPAQYPIDHSTPATSRASTRQHATAPGLELGINQIHMLPPLTLSRVTRRLSDPVAKPLHTCPMPVAAIDSIHVVRMPVQRDLLSRDSMPVVRPECVNPLVR